MLSPRSVYRLFEEVRPPTELLFDPESVETLLKEPELARLLDSVPPGSTCTPREVFLLVLRALAIQRSRLEPRLIGTDLVGTIPGGTDVGIRSTKMVVREMLRAAESDIVILGFEISDEEFLEILAEAAATVPVRILVDRERGSADRITSQWPASLAPPVVYTNRPERGEFAYEKMHSKGILVDGQDLLITSANLTQHGMEGNFELGVRLQGAPAEQMAETVGRLLESELVERWER